MIYIKKIKEFLSITRKVFIEGQGINFNEDIGSNLMNEVIEDLKSEKVVVSSQRNSVNFYRKFGFEFFNWGSIFK